MCDIFPNLAGGFIYLFKQKRQQNVKFAALQQSYAVMSVVASIAEGLASNKYQIN